MIHAKRNFLIRANALSVACALAAFCLGTDVHAQKVANTAKFGGTGLYELAVSQSTGAVYVAAAGGGGRGSNTSGKVFKLDPKTLAAVDSIVVPDAKPMGLAINDKTQTLYTSSPGAVPMNAIDLKTGKVTPIKSDKDQTHIREIIVDEAKNLVYATNLGQPSSIWVIDGKTNTYQYSIEDCGQTTTALALNAKRQLMYVTQMKTGEIGVVDLAAKKMIKSFPTQGSKPINLVYDSKGDRLFVADQGTNEVIVLKAASGELIKKIPAGKGTLGIRFDPDKKRVYTANRQDGTVTVINSDTYDVISTLEAGSAPNTVVVNTKTGVAYVSNKTKAAPRGEGGARPEGGQPAQNGGGEQPRGNGEQPQGGGERGQGRGGNRPQGERPAPAPDPKGDTVTMIVP